LDGARCVRTILLSLPVSDINYTGDWKFDKTMNLADLCSDTSSNIANVIWKDWDSCFIIFQNGYIM
jgi:hypothetical protein